MKSNVREVQGVGGIFNTLEKLFFRGENGLTYRAMEPTRTIDCYGCSSYIDKEKIYRSPLVLGGGIIHNPDASPCCDGLHAGDFNFRGKLESNQPITGGDPRQEVILMENSKIESKIRKLIRKLADECRKEGADACGISETEYALRGRDFDYISGEVEEAFGRKPTRREYKRAIDVHVFGGHISKAEDSE